MASLKVHRAGVQVAQNASHGSMTVHRAGVQVAYWESEPRLHVHRAGVMVAYFEDPTPPPASGGGVRIIGASVQRVNSTAQLGAGVFVVSSGQPLNHSTAES